MKDYPNNVCIDCGVEANRLTCLKKYGQEPKKPMIFFILLITIII